MAHGRHFWNAAMFLVKASRLLEEMARHHPDILAVAEEAVREGARDLDFFRLTARTFARCPAVSLDYAVMEPAEGNILQGDALPLSTRISYLHSEHRLVAAVGVEDLMVVETPDAALVAAKEHSQKVKETVDAPVHLIEVQSGDCLGEDDIIRREDVYGREGEGRGVAAPRATTPGVPPVPGGPQGPEET